MRVEVVEPVKTVQLNYISNRSTDDCFAEMIEEAAYSCISIGPWLLVGLGYQKHSITWLWVVLNSQDGLMLAFIYAPMQTYSTRMEEVQIRPASTL